MKIVSSNRIMAKEELAALRPWVLDSFAPRNARADVVPAAVATAQVHEEARRLGYLPLSEQKIDFSQAIDKALPTLKTFMLKQTRQADLALFMKMANVPEAGGPDEVPFRVIVPAFVTSELKTAFQIGFMIFIPFLIIDLVVASVLMSMGMMMLSPVLISLPFKLMLFVLADGWTLLVGSLVASFAR